MDNRLFLGLARSSAVALAARHGVTAGGPGEFEPVMARWDEIGNVAAQWWVLMQVALLLSRLGVDRPAALLAGFAQRAETAPTCSWVTTTGSGRASTTLQTRLDRDVADGLRPRGGARLDEDAASRSARRSPRVSLPGVSGR